MTARCPIVYTKYLKYNLAQRDVAGVPASVFKFATQERDQKRDRVFPHTDWDEKT